MGGDWQFASYVEAIGPGAEQQVGPTQTVPLNGGTNYATDIIVPAPRCRTTCLPGSPARTSW